MSEQQHVSRQLFLQPTQKQAIYLPHQHEYGQNHIYFLPEAFLDFYNRQTVFSTCFPHSLNNRLYFQVLQNASHSFDLRISQLHLYQSVFLCSNVRLRSSRANKHRLCEDHQHLLLILLYAFLPLFLHPYSLCL